MGDKLDQWVADTAAHEEMEAVMAATETLVVEIQEEASSLVRVHITLLDDGAAPLDTGARFKAALRQAIETMQVQLFNAVGNVSSDMLESIRAEAHAEAHEVLEQTEPPA